MPMIGDVTTTTAQRDWKGWCEWCMRTIRKGHQAQRWAWCDDGRVSTVRVHDLCQKTAEKTVIDDPSEYEINPDVFRSDMDAPDREAWETAASLAGITP